MCQGLVALPWLALVFCAALLARDSEDKVKNVRRWGGSIERPKLFRFRIIALITNAIIRMARHGFTMCQRRKMVVVDVA
jgi:hypothetical protein